MTSVVLLSCCLDWLLIQHHVLKDHRRNSDLVWVNCGTAEIKHKF